MIDLLFQIGLSNACFALALAIVAMLVGAKAKRPHLAHMLWLLVLVKLVTPPIVTIPIVTIPQQPQTAVAINEHSRPGPLPSNSRELNIDAQPDASPWSKLGSAVWNHARVWLPPIWLLGSVVVFAFSMVRVCRFSCMLAAASEVAPQALQTAAAKIARRLELNTFPTIYTTSARLSPMVWWIGGKVRIVIPTALLDQMDAQQSQWILAHELAHVRPRDHLVRWLEWLACVCFWWNPVVWWAQRNLRAMEEICCDDLVISSLNPKPQFYANSILTAVESLACPALRPPAMASEINSGGFLERRFKMIVSETPKRPNTRWLRACVLLCAMVVLPLGIASAQDYKAVERRLGEAVSNGELSLEQAGLMMDALKKAGGAKKDQDSDRTKAYLMKVKKELGAAVEAGRIGREDAAKRYEAAEKGIRERMAAASRQRGGERQRTARVDRRAQYEGFERRIKAAVREGKMTREEAGEQLAGFRRRMEMAERSERGERSITVEEYRRAEAKMRKMVEDGKAKPEDVERRLIEMRKMMAGQAERGGKRDVDWEGIKKRIEGAVKSGKMTREEADAKYEEIKQRMGGQTDSDSKRISREDFAKAAGEIRKAIAEGKITKEQGRAKLAAMRIMIAEKSEGAAKRGVDWEGIKKRIEGAVKSGDMTREEADAKYKEIRERMAGRR
ncbi:hypothetical protein AMJ85_00115 [candidate division BRC1 bacterium SM23_51]|nr:MAG: hypothetical protein AMJ85_00115 [candidate division BRC1 bacterium SM23_51]